METYSSRRAHFEQEAAAMDLTQEVARNCPRGSASWGMGDAYYAPGEHAKGKDTGGKGNHGKGETYYRLTEK
eukprot:2555869-Heterocapsa_arctica.AAC.1